MDLVGPSMVEAMHSDLPVPTDTTISELPTVTSVGADFGFIIALCMVKQCLTHSKEDIIAVYIYKNYNITDIPANGFLGATYLEVRNPYKARIYFPIYIK